MDLAFTNVSERLPDCNGSQVMVYIKKSNGSTSKGMFYMKEQNPHLHLLGLKFKM